MQLVAVHQAGAAIQPPGTYYRIETLALNIHRQEAQRKKIEEIYLTVMKIAVYVEECQTLVIS